MGRGSGVIAAGRTGVRIAVGNDWTGFPSRGAAGRVGVAAELDAPVGAVADSVPAPTAASGVTGNGPGRVEEPLHPTKTVASKTVTIGR